MFDLRLAAFRWAPWFRAHAGGPQVPAVCNRKTLVIQAVGIRTLVDPLDR